MQGSTWTGPIVAALALCVPALAAATPGVIITKSATCHTVGITINDLPSSSAQEVTWRSSTGASGVWRFTAPPNPETATPLVDRLDVPAALTSVDVVFSWTPHAGLDRTETLHVTGLDCSIPAPGAPPAPPLAIPPADTPALTPSPSTPAELTPPTVSTPATVKVPAKARVKKRRPVPKRIKRRVPRVTG